MQQSPAADAVRVRTESLQHFVAELYKRVPIPEEHADLIAHLLVETQMRGVFTHGLRQVERYLSSFQGGTLNTHPRTRVLKDRPVTTAMDGDCGLGIIAADQAIKITIAKAQSHGVAVTTTTHHGHIGSCGKYVRQALHEGLVAFCFAGRNLTSDATWTSDDELWITMHGAPGAAFGLPSGDGLPDFLLDMACRLFSDNDEILERWPSVIFKMMGMSHMVNLMTGPLAGQMVGASEGRHVSYTESIQSGFYMAIDPEHFGGREAYFDDINQLMHGVRRLRPFKGYDTASMAGGPEHEHEAECQCHGVPVWGDVRESLERMGNRYDVPVPWAA